MRTNYQNRIRAATWVSVILHIALIALAWWIRPAFTVGPMQGDVAPITVTFSPVPPTSEPPERPENRQLVDVAVPATEPVRPTDLIATQNSNASDTVAAPGPLFGPKVDEDSPIDRLGGRAGAMPTPSATPAPVQPVLEAPAAEKEIPSEANPAAADPPAPAPPVATSTNAPMALAQATLPAETPKSVPNPAEAQGAPKSLTAPTTEPQAQTAQVGNNRVADSPTRGRAYSGVRNSGVKGFEAMQDVIAPYLKNVQDRVEMRWREALLTKYNGAKATEATIDCEIGPDGKIVSLTITGTPDDRSYAALCKEAIERAGPFGPFTFKVPDIYRNQNLEIRWSFNFL